MAVLSPEHLIEQEKLRKELWKGTWVGLDLERAKLDSQCHLLNLVIYQHKEHKQAKLSKLGPDVKFFPAASIPEVYKTFIFIGVTS